MVVLVIFQAKTAKHSLIPASQRSFSLLYMILNWISFDGQIRPSADSLMMKIIFSCSSSRCFIPDTLALTSSSGMISLSHQMNWCFAELTFPWRWAVHIFVSPTDVSFLDCWSFPSWNLLFSLVWGKEGGYCALFFSCALLLPSSGTGEPFKRAAGQRWEEQRAPWRASQGPLPPRPTAPGPPTPPPPPPAPQLPAVVVPLMLLLLLLPLLLSVVIVVAAAVVVVTLAVLRVAQQQEDRQCLRYLFTVGYLTDKQCRWVGLMWSRGITTCRHT